MNKIPEGYKQTDVGVIPQGWEVKTLGDCLLKKPEYGINVAAVPYSDNLPEKKTSVSNINSNNYFLEKDDIVFARTCASTGKTYLYNSNDGELVFAGFLIRIKVNPNELIAQYLKSYTETGAYRNWVKIMSMRSGQPGINGNEYSQLPILLPSLPEQQAIASSLTDADALITALEQLITKKRNIKQGAMQLLLTGKKRLPGFSGEWEMKKLGECLGRNPDYGINAPSVPSIQITISWKKIHDAGITHRQNEVGMKTENNVLSPAQMPLIVDVRHMIDAARQRVAAEVNAELTLLYWHIGRRIQIEILHGERAGYGEEIIATLAQQLTLEYGRSFEEKNLRRMIQFAETFPDETIVAALRRQLGWSHFKSLIPLNDPLKRNFYAQMCRIERWSTRTLEKQIKSMLYERTALSRKPEELISQEIDILRDEDYMTTDVILKDPYILDFLGMQDRYLEKDLEDAILREIELFLLELGSGFTFIARQKRLQIDNRDLRAYMAKISNYMNMEPQMNKEKCRFVISLSAFICVHLRLIISSPQRTQRTQRWA